MAKALISLASRLRKTHCLPLLLHPFLHSASSSSLEPIYNYCSSATRQSLYLPNQTHLLKLHLLSTKPSPHQNLHESSDFEVDEEKSYNSEEPDIDGFLQLLTQAKQFSSQEEAFSLLDESSIRPTGSLVFSAIWALKNEWELAFLVFKWGEKWGCNNAKGWDLMVWVLGKQRKFNIAWRLVQNMYQSSMSTRRALLILVERYAAANNPGKAIRTFHAMEKFRIIQDTKAFYTLLHALCRHGNVEEAEEFMLLNKKLFPLETEGFNIILNGWCNISIDVVEAKRIWREMSTYCITPDDTSYTHMISCFSKVKNLFDSLRLYDEMKKRGWVPGLQVYNSLIYVLTQENCLKEALNLLEKIKESGLQPDSTTYNSMILPLCEAQQLKEAHNILDTMVREGIDPTTDTYHAFVERESIEGTLGLLNQMKEAGCAPSGFTFLLTLNKIFKLEQPGNALRMWMNMSKYEVKPDSAHYGVVVRGLVACGWLMKAREFYDEMRLKGFLDDPKLEKLLKAPIRVDGDHQEGQVTHKKRDSWGPDRKG